ncbi:NUT family member 1 [Lycaon pictus]
MASDGAPPLPGQDVTLKPGAALCSFSALPFPQSAPGPPDQSPWEPPPQPPLPPAFSAGNPLVLSALPSPLLVTGDGGPGPTGAGVVVKVKTEGGPVEPSQTQSFILTQPALSWIAEMAPPEGPPCQFVTAPNVKTLLPTKAIGVSPEGLPGLPAQAPTPAAQLASVVRPEQAWPGPHGATREGGPSAAQAKPSLGDLSYTSKGVYENFRRWQRYKALVRRHLSHRPDAEALSCFLIPVLRSLARLKPSMTLEEGLPRAVQEWEHTSNFDRMIFYEMAEKFLEFEAEEEMQIQNTQLTSGPQGLPPAAPLKLDPPGLVAPELSQQPVYIPKKVAPRARAPRRRQRKPQRPVVPEAPKEVPLEAVREYTDIVEGLLGASDWKQEDEEEQQQDEERMCPNPGLLSYIDELCSQEVFVSKVEAVIHPQFLADLLSPEQQRDPLALMEELEQEEGLSLAQLVQKRLLALEEEDAEAPPSCSGAPSDSSHSGSDEDEDGGGRLRPSPGPRVAGGAVHLGKAASPGEQGREVQGGERAVDGLQEVQRDGNAVPPPSSWDLQLDLPAPQGPRGSRNMEKRGARKVTNQMSPHGVDPLGGVMSLGQPLVVDRIAETLPLCWQGSPPPDLGSGLGVRLVELAPLQGQGSEEQVLGLQTGQGLGGPAVLPQEMELCAVPQKGSSGAMWGDDRGPPGVSSYNENPSPRAAGDRDGDVVSLSRGLWLSSELAAVGLELPLQMEEVIENFPSRESVTEHQGGCRAGGSSSSSSQGPGETVAPGDEGGSAVSCGGTTGTSALQTRNDCSLPGPLGASSPSLRPNVNSEQGPEAAGDPSGLWVEGCPPLPEGRLSAPTLGPPRETLQPACPGNVLVLGAQGVPSFPQAALGAGSGGRSRSPVLETTEQHVHLLGIGDVCGLQLGGPGGREDTSPPKFTSSAARGRVGEDAGLRRPQGLESFPGNREAQARGPPTAAYPCRGLGRPCARWGARAALVVTGASPLSETRSSAAGARGKEGGEEEDAGEDAGEDADAEEDEGLSGFAYLLASKLSLSPRDPAFGAQPAPGAASMGRGPHGARPCRPTEVGGLAPSPRAAATPGGGTAGAGGPAPARAAAAAAAAAAGGRGVCGDKPPARAPQPRKRRRDTFVSGRRKKRRRSQ